MSRIIDFFKSLGPFKVYKEAFWELFFSFILSTLPLWCLYISLSIYQQDIFKLERFYSLIQNGELFIYAASTLAPVLYLVTKERDNNLKFYGKYFFIAITIIISVISALIIAIQKNQAIKLSEPWLDVSLWLYVISIVALYFVLIINNRMLPDPSSAFRSEEDGYFMQYTNHRS